jgi:hypothetical protein
LKIGTIIVAIGDSADGSVEPLVREIIAQEQAYLEGRARQTNFDAYASFYDAHVVNETTIAELKKPHCANTIAALKWAIEELQQMLKTYEADDAAR